MTSPAVKKTNVSRYSSISPSTARCIEPSGPRSARPGPSMEQSVELSTAMSSKPMADVVTHRYSVLSQSLESEGMSTWMMPLYAKPERSAACVPIAMQFCV